MKAIEFKNIWEMYRVKFIEEEKVKWDDFWPLRGINFEVNPGEAVGIIGPNGSGKSTILKLIAGMLKPDKGEIVVNGKVSGLLELGAGFEPESTGMENTRALCALYGLTREHIKEKIKEIVEFADIGRFINAPVKCYSQGMFVRLAFAIAINVDADILLIDDTLAVGDEYFQRKCIKKIFELKEQGKTIIFVTHDMNMLSRLCRRAIFIKDGTILRDDIVDKTIPLYTQIIGAKNGIGILEKGLLGAVFNNGRLFLNWNGKLITCNSGGYATFLIENKWYNSLQADWEVRKEGEYKLVAIGKFYQLSLAQIWKIEIAQDNEITLDIEVESEGPIEIREGCTSIMLANEYTSWFTPLEKGNFPVIDDKTKTWQALLEGNILRKCLGVETKKDIGGNIFPSLSFEQTFPSNRIRSQILNTDYLANSKVLQYKVSGLQNYSANEANRFLYFSGKIAVGIQDTVGYLEKLNDEFILPNGKLKWIFDNGQWIISYNGVPLTRANHITSYMRIDGKEYTSILASWKVKKDGKDRLLARGAWRDLPVEQIWEVEACSASSFLWRVILQVNEEISIEDQSLRFMCPKDYQYWFSEHINGAFPPDFLETEQDVIQKCISDGPIGLQSQDSKFPMISLKFSNTLGNFAKIFNSNFYDKSRVLRVDKVQAEQDMVLLPGQYPCFAVEVIFNQDKKVFPEDLMNIIETGKLKFMFNNGSGRIYWNGLELTKRIGLYVSLRSNGRWYDSASSAVWKILGRTKDTIEVSGKWMHLPISQDWRIRLVNDNLIEFDISMKIDKAIMADRLQANIMVSENYKEWLAGEKRGIFSQFKGNIDDDWEVLWSGIDGTIGVEKKSSSAFFLPTLIFSPEQVSPKWSLNIINSDLYHRGRVLQYLKKEEDAILPGEYHYYKGKIQIGES